MNDIARLCALLKALTFDEMMEVATALRDRLQDANESEASEPLFYANALSDFAQHHLGDEEEGDA